MNELPDHHCPGCGASQRAFARNPWYFCAACVAGATDGAGRRLSISQDMRLALACRIEGVEGEQLAGEIICLIRGRPVIVAEARFGGIVAEPLQSGPVPEGYKTLDLRGKGA